MAPKFGTSGLRGLVGDLTDDLCAAYTRAFLQTVPQGGRLLVGRDLRPSSPRIARAVMAGAGHLGVVAVDCGELPTPALALAALTAGLPAVMVTGSHIPADRNGLKFYIRKGEITKADETAISAAFAAETGPGRSKTIPAIADPSAMKNYLQRYTDFFADGSLQGLRIGNYQHSSVARDVTGLILRHFGADVIDLGRSGIFIPVDTEAVSTETRLQLMGWAAEHRLDAIVSTDGDGDRPLMTDETGTPIPGDILGVLTADYLGAETVVTPVSSNTMVERMGRFETRRTKIGSPYVIAAMAAAARVVGFEANGGFLLGFPAERSGRRLAPLITRDSLLPIIATLAASAESGQPMSHLLGRLPPRRTASDRLEGVPTDWSLALVHDLAEDAARRASFFALRGPEAALDRTDGLRLTFASGDIVHLRPSGNAPELRCYAESDTADAAANLVADTLRDIRNLVG